MSKDDALILYITPSLVATLLNRERAKQSPLTEVEVMEIRDNCQAIAVPQDIAQSMDESRGYRDIDPENCWEEWQNVREEHSEILMALPEREEAPRIREMLVDRDSAKRSEPLAQYLGRPAVDLIASSPFDTWVFKTSNYDDEPDPGPSYACKEHGLELSCASDGTINTIFLRADANNPAVSQIPFSSSRREMAMLFGLPSKGGAAHSDPILGDYGPWDRFDGTVCSLHVQYRCDVDQIEMLTFMRPEIAP